MAYFDVQTAKVDKINAPLLVVGLGGTGCDGVRRVKHEFKMRLNADRLGGTELDKPPRTAYLGLDTDPLEKTKVYHGTRFEPNDEFLDLSCNIQYLLGEGGAHLDPQVKEWLDSRFYADNDLIRDAATNGAGTYRQLSRLMVFRKAQDILTKLTALLNRLATISPGDPIGARTINVVVISGVSGGTGSGSFLDFAYLLRKAASDASLQIKVDLYLIAPDVTIHHHAAADVSKQIIYKTNSFAAFKELDYWMSYDKRNQGRLKGEVLEVAYNSTLRVLWDCAPYDDVTLLCASNTEGALLSGAYEVVMSAISEMLLLQMASETNRGQVINSQNTDYSQNNDSYSFQAAKSNEYAYLQNIVRPYAEDYCYRAVGAYSNTSEQKNKLYMEAEYIFNDVKAYIELPEHLPNMQSNDPALFFAPYEELFSQFSRDFNSQTQYAQEMFEGKEPWSLKDVRGMVEAQAPHGDVHSDWKRDKLTIKDNCQRDFEKRLTEKFRELSRAYIIEHDPVAFRTMLNDPYNGFIKKIEGKINEYRTEEGNNHAAYTNACAAAQSCFNELIGITGIFSGGKQKDAFERYRAQAKSVYDSKQREMFSEVMKEILTSFKDLLNGQILSYNVEYTIRAIKNIQEDLSTEVRAITDAAGATTLTTVEDMRQEILAVYSQEANKKRLMDSVLNSVADACVLTDNKGAKTTEDAANNLIDKIDEIIQSMYHDVNDVSLQKMLSGFGGVDGQQVAQYVQSTLAPNLVRGAQPHFALNPAYGKLNTTNAVISSYISVPYNAPQVQLGIRNFINANGDYSGAVIKNSNILDRVFWMNIVSGLPLCAYGLLSKYETTYEQNKNMRPGTHLIRMNDDDLRALNKERNVFTDWSYLPSPVPAKELAEKPLEDSISRRIKADDELLERAEQAGLIVYYTDQGDYRTFSSRVMLYKDEDGKLFTKESVQKALNEIEQAHRIPATKLANVESLIQEQNRYVFDPVDDVRFGEQVVEFSKALNKHGIFSNDIETQKLCFRELVRYKLSKRPVMMNELRQQIEIGETIAAAKEKYLMEIDVGSKRTNTIKDVARMWLFDLIKFNPMSVGYRDRQDNYQLNGKDNILFKNADTVCKEDYAFFAPIQVRLVEWYALQTWSKEPFATLASKLKKVYEKSQDPSEADVPKCVEYRTTAGEYVNKIEGLITQLQADQDEISSKKYYDATMEVLEGMQKELKALQLMWRGL